LGTPLVSRCGFCKKLKPTYLALGASYSTHSKDVLIGAIDADEYQMFVHEHGYTVTWLYIGIADGMSVMRVWTCRYSKRPPR
jgi:hypothetical protein